MARVANDFYFFKIGVAILAVSCMSIGCQPNYSSSYPVTSHSISNVKTSWSDELQTKLENLAIENQHLQQANAQVKTEIELLYERLDNQQQTTTKKLHDLYNSLQACIKNNEKSTAQLLLNYDKNVREHQSLTIKNQQLEDRLKLIENQFMLLTEQNASIAKNIEAITQLLQGTQASAHATHYQVQAGDSLEKIAKKHHVSVEKLKEINQLTSDKIRVGQQLQVSP